MWCHVCQNAYVASVEQGRGAEEERFIHGGGAGGGYSKQTRWMRWTLGATARRGGEMFIQSTNSQG